MTNKLPEFLKPYFWDVDFEKMDGVQYPLFVISRVIDKGDTNALRWILKNYSKEQITNTLKISREMSHQTAKFWSKMLSINEEEVLCLRKPYSPIPFELSI